MIFVEPACGEQDIVVKFCSVCACVMCACVHLFGFVWAITWTFMYGFQNNLAQLLFSRSAI